jgi:hypothetical protein
MWWTKCSERCFFSRDRTGPATSNHNDSEPDAPVQGPDYDSLIIHIADTFYMDRNYDPAVYPSIDELYSSLFLGLAQRNTRRNLDLKIVQWCPDSMRGLFVYLVTTTMLQGLRLQGDCLFDFSNNQLLVKAISRNTSLSRVEMLRRDGSSGLSVRERTLVAAYLARNSNIHSLLCGVHVDRKRLPWIWTVAGKTPRILLAGLLALQQSD